MIWDPITRIVGSVGNISQNRLREEESGAALQHVIDLPRLQYLCEVTVEDDSAAELYQWHRRFLHFYPDEVEPLGAGANEPHGLSGRRRQHFFGDDGLGVEAAR
jgi:hypothetical protein